MKRKLLLIMPNFFDYPQAICEELEKMGYEVDCFDDRPSTNGMVKAIIRVNKNLIGQYINRYFEKVMKTVRAKKYDVVFLISGQSLSFSEDMIQQIKDEQPQAKYVLYQWDSLKNFPYIEKIEPYFDKCYSFDKNDVATHENLKFLPLFYTRRYENIGNSKKREFQFDPLAGKEMDRVFANSKCVLDSAQAGQIGLTIRVLEALGAKKKLITTNEDVVNYDFYREENIYVYDGHFDLKAPFFNSDYVEVENSVYEKYSLRNWLKEIIGE